MSIVNYKSLVNMDLQSARKAIINNLVEIKFNKREEIKKVEEDIKDYTEKLAVAKADGDTSENSSYEINLAKLAVANGNLFALQQQLLAMDSIEDPEYKMTFSTNKEEKDFEKRLVDTEDNVNISAYIYDRILNRDIKNMRIITPEQKEKIREFVRTMDKMGLYNDDEITVYHEYMDYAKNCRVRMYNPCGRAVMYSVVRVEIANEDYVFMICPNDISYAQDGIVAANTLVGSSLLGREVNGERITINDGLSYIIKEIY